MKFQTYLRTSIFSEVKNYCHLSKKHDFIEITEWNNGEGFDIHMGDERNLSITFGEFELLKKMVKQLEKENE